MQASRRVIYRKPRSPAYFDTEAEEESDIESSDEESSDDETFVRQLAAAAGGAPAARAADVDLTRGPEDVQSSVTDAGGETYIKACQEEMREVTDPVFRSKMEKILRKMQRIQEQRLTVLQSASFNLRTIKNNRRTIARLQRQNQECRSLRKQEQESANSMRRELKTLREKFSCVQNDYDDESGVESQAEKEPVRASAQARDAWKQSKKRKTRLDRDLEASANGFLFDRLLEVQDADATTTRAHIQAFLREHGTYRNAWSLLRESLVGVDDRFAQWDAKTLRRFLLCNKRAATFAPHYNVSFVEARQPLDAEEKDGLKAPFVWGIPARAWMGSYEPQVCFGEGREDEYLQGQFGFDEEGHAYVETRNEGRRYFLRAHRPLEPPEQLAAETHSAAEAAVAVAREDTSVERGEDEEA